MLTFVAEKKRGRIFSFFNIFSFKGENVEVGFAQVSVLDNRFWIHHQFDSARKNCSRDHLFFTRLKW